MPVLGALFRSSHFRKNESELVVIVTPYLVRPVSNPANIALPTDNVEPANDLERLLQGRIARQKNTTPPPVKLKGDAGFIYK